MNPHSSRRSIACAGAALLLALAAACDHPAPIAPILEPGAGDVGLVIQNPFAQRPTFFDFGTLAYGDQARHVFQIKNLDPDPVTILQMQPSCGCTLPTFRIPSKAGLIIEGSRTPGEAVITIPSGAVAELEVAIDTSFVERMNIDKLAMVALRSDSKTTPYLRLEVHLVVERTFRAVPAMIDLSETPSSIGKQGSTSVSVDVKGTPARILGVEAVDGPFDAAVDETSLSDETYWILSVSARRGLPLGPVQGRVMLKTTGRDGTGTGQPFRVDVSAQIAPDVVLHPAVFAFGAIQRGKEARVEAELVQLVPQERVLVKDARLSGLASDELEIERAPIHADEKGRAASWKIRLVAPASLATSPFSGTLTLELDDPTVPAITVPYSGTLK